MALFKEGPTLHSSWKSNPFNLKLRQNGKENQNYYFLSFAHFRLHFSSKRLLPFAWVSRLLDYFERDCLFTFITWVSSSVWEEDFSSCLLNSNIFSSRSLKNKIKHIFVSNKYHTSFTKWSSDSISGITLPPRFVFASREELPPSRSKSQSVKNSDMNDKRKW